MRTIYIADDGIQFDSEQACKSHEARKGFAKTAYASTLEKMSTGEVCRAALGYSIWLRDKQNYPATDSGEHKCCDLLNELVKRL